MYKKQIVEIVRVRMNMCVVYSGSNLGFPLFREKNPSWKWNNPEFFFATNSNFIIRISFQSYTVNLWDFKLRLFDLKECYRLTYLSSTTMGRDLKIWVYDKNSIPLFLKVEFGTNREEGSPLPGRQRGYATTNHPPSYVRMTILNFVSCIIKYSYLKRKNFGSFP